MSDADSIRYGADGRLDADVTCATCGHNLRGLPADGRCGECGDPVSYALRGGGLAVADADWVETLRGGIARVAGLYLWLWCPLVWPAFVYGLWQVSTPPPWGEPGRRNRSIWLARSMAIGVPVAAIGYASTVTGIMVLGVLPALNDVLGLLACLWLLSFVMGVSPALRWNRAKRIPGLCVWASVEAGIGAFMFGAALATSFNPVAWMFEYPLIIGGGLLAALAAYATIGVIVTRMWRMLHVAAVQSHATRRETRYWQRGVPGFRASKAASAWPLSASDR